MTVMTVFENTLKEVQCPEETKTKKKNTKEN